MDNSFKHAIIVAGGSGSRMGSTVPKQFLELNRKPILMYTIEAFYHADSGINIVITLPQDHIYMWKKLCLKLRFNIPHTIVNGGATRFQSVKNGLASIPDTGMVAIHDGVRPFVTKEIIDASYKTAQQAGNAVAAVKLKDSIRLMENDTTKSLNRELYYLIQTPQTFKVQLIKKAFEVEDSPLFTDDATVLEQIGEKINLIEGSYHNIKITTREDLIIAKALIEAKNG